MQGVEELKYRSFYAVGLILMWVVALLFLRKVLISVGLPDGSGLEDLAQCIQHRETSIAEAVSAFCREIATDGPY